MREEACTIWKTECPQLASLQVSLIMFYSYTLSHPSVQKPRSVISIESFIFNLGCEFYELGKHQHATYQSRVNNRSISTFELVHSDV